MAWKAYARDGKIWLSQSRLAEHFSISKQNISSPLINIREEKGLDEDQVVKDFLTTAAGGRG